MKKIILSTVAILSLSSFAMAGGDIEVVEEQVIELAAPATDTGFYVGLGYGWTGFNGNGVGAYNTPENNWDINLGSIMIDGGYKFNQYIAVEGRYWFGLQDSNDLGWTSGAKDVTVDSWAIYAKPMYPVTSEFNVYGLIGFAGTDVEVDNLSGANFDASGFSWGIGADYKVVDNVSVFIDYTSIVQNEGVTFGGLNLPLEMDTDKVTVGVNYKF